MILRPEPIGHRRANPLTFVDGDGQFAGYAFEATLVASVQPASGDDVRDIPAARMASGRVKLYTTTAVSAGGPDQPADEVQINGEWWLVVHTEDQTRPAPGALPHWKVIAVRKEATNAD